LYFMRIKTLLLLLCLGCNTALQGQFNCDFNFENKIVTTIQSINKKILNAALYGKTPTYTEPSLQMSTRLTPEEIYRFALIHSYPPGNYDTIIEINLFDSFVWHDMDFAYATKSDAVGEFASKPYSIGIATHRYDQYESNLRYYWFSFDSALKFFDTQTTAFLKTYCAWKFTDNKHSREDTEISYRYESWKLWNEHDLILVGSGVWTLTRLSQFIDTTISHAVMTSILKFDITFLDSSQRKIKIDESFPIHYGYSLVQNHYFNKYDSFIIHDTLVEKSMLDYYYLDIQDGKLGLKIALYYLPSWYEEKKKMHLDYFYLNPEEVKRILSPKLYSLCSSLALINK
jgi:hypothetical protein